MVIVRKNISTRIWLNSRRQPVVACTPAVQVKSVVASRSLFITLLLTYSFYTSSLLQSLAVDRMEEVEEIKFEELDEALDDVADWEEIKDVKDCSFNRFYNPIRSLFSSDSSLLEKFTNCTNHAERLQLLAELEVMMQLLSISLKKGKLSKIWQGIAFCNVFLTPLEYLKSVPNPMPR